MNSLKGKKVFKVEDHKHLYNYGTVAVDIIFDDGTILHLAHRPHNIETQIRHGTIPQKKEKPWIKNEKAFFDKLSSEEKKNYKDVKKAFFWIIDHHAEVENFYTYTDKNWVNNFKIDGKRKQFHIQVDMDEDDPKDILTIFMSSNIAPECDNWLRLGMVKDWDKILQVCADVRKGD